MLSIWTLYVFHNIASQPYYEGADWLHHSNRNAPEAVTNYSGADLESMTNVIVILFSDNHWVKRTGQAVEWWF